MQWKPSMPGKSSWNRPSWWPSLVLLLVVPVSYPEVVLDGGGSLVDVDFTLLAIYSRRIGQVYSKIRDPSTEEKSIISSKMVTAITKIGKEWTLTRIRPKKLIYIKYQESQALFPSLILIYASKVSEVSHTEFIIPTDGCRKSLARAASKDTPRSARHERKFSDGMYNCLDKIPQLRFEALIVLIVQWSTVCIAVSWSWRRVWMLEARRALTRRPQECCPATSWFVQ